MQQKYRVDSNYFDSVDSEAKAYWLGFITADGCITSEDLFKLVLAEVDREHLEKFIVDINSTYPLHREESHGHVAYGIYMRNKAFVESLETWGIGPRKTFEVEPAVLPLHLERHYWRGIFDGDGCVSNTRDMLALCGNFAIVEGFHQYCIDANSDLDTRVTPKGNIFQVQFGGRKAKAVATLLYDGSSTYLMRKKSRVTFMLGAA